MIVDMVRRSDSRVRMISAARQLFREHGYRGTALVDVIAASEAPRGSMYFHFPGGKEELAGEVILAHGTTVIAQINRAAASTDSAAELIAAFLGHYRDDIADSGYRQGCAVTPIVIEVTPASEALSAMTRQAFGDAITILTARLEEKSIDREHAKELAVNTLVAMEGALILSRALRSRQPFDAAIAALTASA
jgi:TetR/AcrR family transcriptional regulator, lmrAB and yxaGH operons repressor